MRSRLQLLTTFLTLTILTFSAFAMAIPPGAESRGFVEGANHHLGDQSFIARFGRAPTTADSEAVRMDTHLRYVRQWLGSRVATRPELQQRRTELLGYLDDYIQLGTTPRNRHLPWRNPVFVDEEGHVCAVGYLIERSVGRPLVERIAALHRHDYLEDITLPEVTGWIENSGFTLLELASIQPGYFPEVVRWETWDLSESHMQNGSWSYTRAGRTVRGSFDRGQMHGAWNVVDAQGRSVGTGTLSHGHGRWRSTYPSGRLMAVGRMRRSRASGHWRFFHHSGRIAAEGLFRNGQRYGNWTFYHDQPDHAVLIRAVFGIGGLATGRWTVFDEQRRLVATAWSASSTADPTEPVEGYAIRLVPDASGLLHESHQFRSDGNGRRIDFVRLGAESLFVARRNGYSVVDSTGHLLTREAGVWRSADCHFNARVRTALARHDLAALQSLWPVSMEFGCDASQPVSTLRSSAIDRVFAALNARRIAFPATMTARVPSNDDVSPTREPEETTPSEPEETTPSESEETTPSEPVTTTTEVPPADDDSPDGWCRRAPWLEAICADLPVDLGRELFDTINWFLEWRYVDATFMRVFFTLPDHFVPDTMRDAPQLAESTR